jgi:hypothetical protein
VKRELEEDLKLLKRATSNKQNGDKQEAKESRSSSSQRAAGRKVPLSRGSSTRSKQANQDIANPVSITGKRATRSKISLKEDESSISDF